MSLKEYFVCLFVCFIADSEHTDSNKPIFRFLKRKRKIGLLLSVCSKLNCVWSQWFLLIIESFSLDTSGKTTSFFFDSSETAWSYLIIVHWQQYQNVGAIALSYPNFLLMILLQNFMLIKNHIETWIWKLTEIKLFKCGLKSLKSTTSGEKSGFQLQKRSDARVFMAELKNLQNFKGQ